MHETLIRSQGVVVAFPDAASRPQRPHLSAGEPRGEILLFTGVRYERPTPSSDPSKPFASNGPGSRRGF